MKNNHGGKRAKAGRPKGSFKGNKSRSVSITLTQAQWAKLDALRGDMTKTQWFAIRLDRAGETVSRGIGRVAEKGSKSSSTSITLRHEQWDKLDRIRGKQTPSQWFGERVNRAKGGES